MTTTAKGPFDVKTTPQGNTTDPEAVGRFSLDKTFHGDSRRPAPARCWRCAPPSRARPATSRSSASPGRWPAARGTFALQHWGMMDKGAPDLKISVIPDSGTGDLTGLAGTMTIDIQPGGKHFYAFTYTLPPAAK